MHCGFAGSLWMPTAPPLQLLHAGDAWWLMVLCHAIARYGEMDMENFSSGLEYDTCKVCNSSALQRRCVQPALQGGVLHASALVWPLCALWTSLPAWSKRTGLVRLGAKDNRQEAPAPPVSFRSTDCHRELWPRQHRESASTPTCTEPPDNTTTLQRKRTIFSFERQHFFPVRGNAKAFPARKVPRL